MTGPGPVGLLAVSEAANLLQLSFAGLALGSLYALVALGFVVIYKSTGVINFAQGGLVLLGAYLTYDAHRTWKLPFVAAVPVAMLLCAMVGVAVERLVLRRMVGQPLFAVVMATIGLLIFLQALMGGIWGEGQLPLGDPFGLARVELAGVSLAQKDVWTVVLAGVVLVAFHALFRWSRTGLGMRAMAADQEAALSLGISARRVFAVSWALSAAIATIAGVMLSSGAAGGVSPSLALAALLAFPAIILGGLDSPLGAVVGGVVIGMVQTLTAGYQPRFAPWLGAGFDQVTPYVVMIAILAVRPHGLFGTKEVRRA